MVKAGTEILAGGAQVLAVLVLAPLLRRRYNRWGARPAEAEGALPGDGLVTTPGLGYTRAITIDAPMADVWPWLVQIGQGRGGLYSFDGLENLVGCRIHSADTVLPEHQAVRPGDLIRLGPDGYPSFRVAEVDPPTTLVLLSAGPEPADGTGGDETRATWQWVLRPADGGCRTRLVVRQRLRCPRSQRWMWRAVEPVGFVMERRMLHGIRQRAERRRHGGGVVSAGRRGIVRPRLSGAGVQRRLAARLGGLDLPTEPPDDAPVTDEDLQGLPAPAQRYLRFMGVPGRPRDWSFTARWSGHFRLRPGQGWQPFEAWQYNSAPAVARVFAMRIDVAGLVPMFGTDTYVAGRGRMRGKVLGLIPVADGSGPEFDLGELVTFLNDAVMLAPGMLLASAVSWRPVDDDSFDLVLTDHGTTVTARVSVDELGRVREFSTTDRFCSLPTGLVRARWTTPVPGWTTAAGRPVPVGGAAIWHLPDGPYEYARAGVDPWSIVWNAPPSAVAGGARQVAAGAASGVSPLRPAAPRWSAGTARSSRVGGP